MLPNGRKICIPNFSFLRPSIIQIGIFGLKRNHLATLAVFLTQANASSCLVETHLKPEAADRNLVIVKKGLSSKGNKTFSAFFSRYKKTLIFSVKQTSSLTQQARAQNTHSFNFRSLRLLLFFQFSPPFKVFNFRVLLFPVFTNFSIAAATALNRQHTAN
jgi:hypothetical protein